MISDLFSCLLFIGYLFILSIVSFETQSSELENQFVFFSPCACALGVESLLTQCHGIPGFLLSVLWLLFLHWDVDPFCVVLYMGVRCGVPPSCFPLVAPPAVPAPLVKGTVLSHWLDRHPCQWANGLVHLQPQFNSHVFHPYARTTVLDFDIWVEFLKLGSIGLC